MTCDPLTLAQSGVQKLQPYLPGKPISDLAREIGLPEAKIIKLASNENPLGPSPKVNEMVQAALWEQSRYPDGGAVELRRQLAVHHQCDPEQITIGNGSNDVLDLIARVFLGAGKSTVFSEHAFAVYPLAAQAVGAESIVTPANNWGHDLDAMLSAIREDTTVVWVANPNNPTGTWINQNQLHDFLAKAPENVIVVVDEAYFEFASAAESEYPDSSKWLDEFPNLIVTRTFSKAYGLAGYRIGYGVSSTEITDLLNRVRAPFNSNTLAQIAAVTAMEDQNHVVRGIELNQTEMKKLETAFNQMELNYIPSIGNFVSVDVGQSAMPVFDALLKEGVIVRPVGNYKMPNHLRVTVGLPEENEKFLNALSGILNS